jgi:hypothetical protein
MQNRKITCFSQKSKFNDSGRSVVVISAETSLFRFEDSELDSKEKKTVLVLFKALSLNLPGRKWEIQEITCSRICDFLVEI